MFLILKIYSQILKEEKILIIALESKSQNEITTAVTEVLKKCMKNLWKILEKSCKTSWNFFWKMFEKGLKNIGKHSMKNIGKICGLSFKKINEKFNEKFILQIIYMVGVEGIEPTPPKWPDFESGASTSSAILPNYFSYFYLVFIVKSMGLF